MNYIIFDDLIHYPRFGGFFLKITEFSREEFNRRAEGVKVEEN
jgi:hypothetical protein